MEKVLLMLAWKARSRLHQLWTQHAGWLLALCAITIAAPLEAADPATFRGDLRRTGVFDGRPGRWLAAVKWSFATSGPLRGSPVCTGEVVLFGSGDGNLYALDAATGRERWRAPQGGAVHATPAVEGGRVFVVSRRGGLTATDLATGRRLWSFPIGADVPFAWGYDFLLSSPAVVGGTVYVGSGDGHLYAVEARTGRERWRLKTNGRVRSSPAVDGGVLYFGSQDGRVWAVDVASGKPKWTFEIGGFSLDLQKEGYDRRSIQSTPALSADGLFIGTRDGHAYALDRLTGALRWKFGHKVTWLPGSPDVSWVEASPALAGELVLVGSSDGRAFRANRVTTGEELWRFETPDRVLSSAAVAGGLVFFGCDDGHVFALDIATGSELWRFRTGGQVISSPAISGSCVFVGSDDGKLYALATSDAARPGRSRRAVFWAERGPGSWFKGDARVRDFLAAEGYAVLDGPALLRFLAEANAAESVVVFASDRFPEGAVAEPFDACPLRRFSAAGGRAVWLGLPPAGIAIDPKTGKPAGYDPTRTERLLSVSQAGSQPDLLGSEATPEGRRWGLPPWWIGGFSVPGGDVTEVLGRDEYGRASAWVKSVGGPPGSGLVRLWGREDAPNDLSWLRSVAEH